MKYFIIFLLPIIIILTNCSTPSKAPVIEFGFVVDDESKGTALLVNKSMEHEFQYLDYDKSEKSIRFSVKIKNNSKDNKIFNVKDVILVIASTKGNKPVTWKITARDASLADKELINQIANLEKHNNNNSNSVDQLVSNLSAQNTRSNQNKSIKERREEIAEKTFYTSMLTPGKIITGLMYFSIEDESFLTSLSTTMHFNIKGDKSKTILFKYKPVSTL